MFILFFVHEFRNRLNKDFFLLTFKVLLYISVLGLVLNYFIDFPWKSSEVNIAGVYIKTASEGYMGSYRRLSGFFPSNGVASFYILSMYIGISIFNFLKYKKFILFNYIWFLTFLGLLLSTLKTAVFAFLMVSIFMYLNNKSYKNLLLLLKNIILIYVFMPIFISVYLFLTGFQTTLTPNELITNETFRIMFATIIDRMINVWPKAFSLVDSLDIFLFGRGLGGIGVSQKIFEVNLYTSGDSLFVHLLINFGIFITFLVIVFLLINLFSKNIINSLLIFLILIIASTQNIIDSPILLTIFFLFYNLSTSSCEGKKGRICTS
jgi:hypothetical protein